MFIRDNGHKHFSNWSDAEIVTQLLQSISDDVIAWSQDKNGKLNGIVFGRKDHKSHTIHIFAIVITEPGLLKQYIRRFNRVFRSWNLTGLRDNKGLVNYTKRVSIYGS